MSILNHKKIEITSKRTGESIVILDTEEGVFGGVADGIPVTECVDDSLDTAVYIVKSTKKQLFEQFDVVTVTIANDDGIVQKNMCVASDTATLYQRHLRTYEHTVTITEQTKILEKFKIHSLNLTNKSDNLLKQATKALNNAVTRVITFDEFPGDCLFSLSVGLRNLLSINPGQDFYFSSTDLRAVMDSILESLNARCTVEEIEFDDDKGEDFKRIVIGYRNLADVQEVNPVWTRSAHGEIVNEELSNDAQDYAGKIVARGVNTITTDTLSVTDIFKSTEASLTSENSMMLLPLPISENGIKNLFVGATYIKKEYYSLNVGFVETDRTTVYIDVAKYLIDSRQYELLDDETKKGYLFYEVGASAINASVSHKNFIFTRFNLETILEKVIKEHPNVYPQAIVPSQPFEAGDIEASYVYDFQKHPFTCEYYPQINTCIDFSKPGVYDKDRLQMGIWDNQSENTLELERHGKHLLSLIRRTGNDEDVIDVNATKYSTLLPLMARITGGYVVYKREIAIYDRFVQCRYYLSKDFNAIQSKEGVNRNKHIYDIPMETEECPIVIKQYMMFSKKVPVTEIDGTYNVDLLVSALNTARGASGKRIKYMLFQSYCGDEVYPQNTENSDGEYPYADDDMYVFQRPVYSYGQGMCMAFVATVRDNYSVDYARDGFRFSIWGDGGYRMTYSRYVSNEEDTVGECDAFSVMYAFDCDFISNPDDYSNYDELVKLFPVSHMSYYDKAQAGEFTVLYYKDRSQHPYFYGLLECKSANEDYNDLIIGTAFCRDNNLVRARASGASALLYVSTTARLSDVDDSISGKEFVLVGDAAEYFSIVPNTEHNYVTLTFTGDNLNFDGVTAWAIVNDAGDIYIAANGEPCTVYAFMQNTPQELDQWLVTFFDFRGGDGLMRDTGETIKQYIAVEFEREYVPLDTLDPVGYVTVEFELEYITLDIQLDIIWRTVTMYDELMLRDEIQNINYITVTMRAEYITRDIVQPIAWHDVQFVREYVTSDTTEEKDYKRVTAYDAEQMIFGLFQDTEWVQVSYMDTWLVHDIIDAEVDYDTVTLSDVYLTQDIVPEVVYQDVTMYDTWLQRDEFFPPNYMTATLFDTFHTADNTRNVVWRTASMRDDFVALDNTSRVTYRTANIYDDFVFDNSGLMPLRRAVSISDTFLLYDDIANGSTQVFDVIFAEQFGSSIVSHRYTFPVGTTIGQVIQEIPLSGREHYTFTGYTAGGVSVNASTSTPIWDEMQINAVYTANVYVVTVRHVNQRGDILLTQTLYGAYNQQLTIMPTAVSAGDSHYTLPAPQYITITGNRMITMTYVGHFYTAHIISRIADSATEIRSTDYTTQYPASMGTVFDGSAAFESVGGVRYNLVRYADINGNTVSIDTIKAAVLTDNTAVWYAVYAPIHL